MTVRRIVSWAVLVAFLIALPLALGCGRKETPSTSNDTGGAAATATKALKMPGEARGAAGAANKQIEGAQPKSTDDL